MSTQPQLLPITLHKNDVVYTPDWVARDMVEFFKPSGRILEPSSGDGAFLKYLPGADWCEIEKGRDFFACVSRYDWIVGNPPWSLYNDFMDHSFKLADNILFLIPHSKPHMSYARLISLKKWGWIKHSRIYGSGNKLNFPLGFPVSGIHFQRGYTGPMYTSFYEGDK